MQPLFLHRISVVRVYLYMAATTTDPAGRDLRHLAHPHHSIPHNLQAPFLQQAMILRQEVITALPKTQKKTQGGFQIEETKIYDQNERTELQKKN